MWRRRWQQKTRKEKEDKVLVGRDDVDVGLISNTDNIYSCDYDERLFKYSLFNG